MGLPAMAFQSHAFNINTTLENLLSEMYGDNYHITLYHSDMYATCQANFHAKDPINPSHQIHIPYYIVENGDPKMITDFLDPYLIKLTITQCCAIIEEALKLAKKG